MAKKKLYGAALAAHEKKIREMGKKAKASAAPAAAKRSYKFSFGEVDDIGPNESGYWDEYARQEKKIVPPTNLKGYPTPAVIHKEINYYRPLTVQQKRAKVVYDAWLASKPTKALTKEEKQQKAETDFKGAYERWEKDQPFNFSDLPASGDDTDWARAGKRTVTVNKR